MSKTKRSMVSGEMDDAAIILRVASLIEQGSFGMQQITGHYLDKGKNGTPTGCCSMGAILISLGKTEGDGFISFLELLKIWTWPKITYPKVDGAPFAADEQSNVASLPDVIIYLNDRLGWSFSRIVDYLRDCTLPKATIIKVK